MNVSDRRSRHGARPRCATSADRRGRPMRELGHVQRGAAIATGSAATYSRQARRLDARRRAAEAVQVDERARSCVHRTPPLTPTLSPQAGRGSTQPASDLARTWRARPQKPPSPASGERVGVRGAAPLRRTSARSDDHVEPRKQLLVDAAEAAVAHHEHVVAGRASAAIAATSAGEVVTHRRARRRAARAQPATSHPRLAA